MYNCDEKHGEGGQKVKRKKQLSNCEEHEVII